jgi:hypothetical protein
MDYHGYRVEYFVRWSGKKSAYAYQRFYRALYGYTQVVSKSSGKTYTYYREGVLTRYPFVKDGRNAVVIPDSALQPLLSFLKTGQNPAHSFANVANWTDLVKYSISEVTVDAPTAAAAVFSAISRIPVKTITGSRPAVVLLNDIDVLSPDELYSLYYAIAPTVRSRWYSAFSSSEDYAEISNRIAKLLSRLSVTS